MLDRALIAHASPTLARLKLGNLFSYRLDGGFAGEFLALRTQLRQKGVELTVLRVNRGSALVYVYRADELEKVLAREDVWAFLAAHGYSERTAEAAVRTLRGRLRASEGFPHEIGVFLGYPLEDVIGFIRNGGRNCLACGCWKVYSNTCEAMRQFRRFEKCTTVYARLFASGCPLTRLTVAARTA